MRIEVGETGAKSYAGFSRTFNILNIQRSQEFINLLNHRYTYLSAVFKDRLQTHKSIRFTFNRDFSFYRIRKNALHDVHFLTVIRVKGIYWSTNDFLTI